MDTTYFTDISSAVVPDAAKGSMCEGFRLIRPCTWVHSLPGIERWQVEDRYAAPHYEGKLLDLTFTRIGMDYVFISERKIIEDEE